MPPSPMEVDVLLEVPFHDVDAMKVVWHGHYVKYLEIARTALTRQLGLDIQDVQTSDILWPVVVCQLKYIRPLRYGQQVRIVATLTEWESRLRVDYRIQDAATGTLLTKAHTIQAALKADTGEMLFQIPPGTFPHLPRTSA